jgi:hypothetical protein
MRRGTRAWGGGASCAGRGHGGAMRGSTATDHGARITGRGSRGAVSGAIATGGGPWGAGHGARLAVRGTNERVAKRRGAECCTLLKDTKKPAHWRA